MTEAVSTARAPIEILLVEDNLADVRLTIEALKESTAPYRLRVARDGVDALDVLRSATTDSSLPDLILLDLNLPRKDGREVLAAVKADSLLKHIPVVILTTSRAEADVVQSYQLHANAVVTKPVDVDQFFSVVRAIERFWLEVVKLPRS